jgi:hypothetical protein
VRFLTQAYYLHYIGLPQKRVSVDCTGRLHYDHKRYSFLFYRVHDSVFHDYSGLLPSLAGVTHVAIQFPVYEKAKLYVAKKGSNISFGTELWDNMCKRLTEKLHVVLQTILQLISLALDR